MRQPVLWLPGCLFSVVLAVGSATLSAPAATVAAVPAVVARAAAANATALEGTIVHDRHMSVAVSAGPLHYSEQNDAVLLMVGGQYQRLRYTRVVENGKALDADRIAQLETKTDRLLQSGKGTFKQPFDQRYLEDYTYQTDPACACGPNTAAIRFHSLVRDDQHGDGLMRIDRASGRVLDVTYTPDILPAHANSCTTTESFADVLPGVWTIVRIERSYRGHIAFFGGGGDVVETLNHFKIVPNAQSGLAYLDDTAQAERLR
ncbi:MAG: hypothetical protein ACYDGM_07465 [Vulcanimicrobiaceae bacterium]